MIYKSFMWKLTWEIERDLLKIIGEYAGATSQTGQQLFRDFVEPHLPEDWTVCPIALDREFYVLKFIVTETRRSITKIMLHHVWRCVDEKGERAVFYTERIPVWPWAAIRERLIPKVLTKHRWVAIRERFQYEANFEQFSKGYRLGLHMIETFKKILGNNGPPDSVYEFLPRYVWDALTRHQNPTDYKFRRMHM